MERLFLSQRRSLILYIGIVILATVAIILYRWANRVPTQPQNEISKIMPTATLATISSSTASLVSPLSPISSVSPLPRPTPHPTTMEFMVQEGIDLYNRQDYTGAIKIFDNVLAQDPKNFLAYNARGTAYIELDKYDQAIADYSNAIKLHPLFADAYYNRGRIYRLLKKYEEAITEFKKSVELSPTEFGYRANGNIGLIYHRQGEYAKALEAFAIAISYDSSKADTYYLRGETYTAMENYEAAISDYEAAISRFSNYSQAYQSLGYAYYKTKQFDQALETLNKALEFAPNSPTPHFYRMLVYLATHQADNAQAEVSQGMDAIGALSEEEQNFLFKRVLGDLESFAQKNPSQAKEVEALVNLIPPQ